MLKPPNNAIAIVGMAGRFPDAPNLEAFWRNLAAGLESLSSLGDEELLAAGVDPALLSHPNYVRKGTFLKDADSFDAGFFGYNPREAEVIDPQHRVFLECAWEALEDAGYAGEARPRSVGVYAGTSINTYLFSQLLPNRALLETVGPYQLMLACDKDFLATRAAYKLNLKGPCLSIQTACSTALVAVQVACMSLISGQCDMALAGGVSLTFPANSGYLYTEGMILSPDGHCRPFDAKARGTRDGSGAGIVVLKRLAEALRDGDTIRAVIRGAAVNNDGALKMGYTAPGVDGQAEVIAAAQAMAGVKPESITYIETHGTATELGDPIEFAALERVFRAGTARRQFCAIGSLKSNIGHLDAAAGVAGLIKTVLALEHKAIPPSINFEEPNPQIDFTSSPFFVNDRLREWQSEGGPRRAGVSSFGIGGTNAHVVVEEAPPPAESVLARQEQVLILSARSETALEQAASRLAGHLENHPELDLADACYTLQVGRKAFAHRRALVCRDRGEAMELLRRPQAGRIWTAHPEITGRPVAFLFSGQGSQHTAMAAALYRTEAVFRENLDRCAAILQPEIGCDLRDMLYRGDSDQRVNETRFAQPALFAVEYSLAQMWMAWGIKPAAALGHSIGEYVAACLAGVFALEDALAIVAARGKLMQQVPPGVMLAAPLPAAQAALLLNGTLSLAAVNTPSLCTFSGPAQAIAELERKLEARGITGRRIHTSHAFHSSMMDPILDDFRERLAQVRMSAPRMAYLSNVTGDWIRPEEATDPGYWARHLRQTVQFDRGLERLLDEPGRVLLEVGPGQALTTFAREAARLRDCSPEVFATLPHPRDSRPDDRHALEALARLWIAGVEVNWEGFHGNERLRRVPLPTYPFERQRYAPGPVPQETPASRPDVRKPDIADWFYIPSWKRSVRPSQIGMTGVGGPYVVFLDETGVGAAVAALLSARGERVATVRAGGRFERTGPTGWLLNPALREDYDRLFAALAAEDLLPCSLLHLWNVGDAIPDGASFYSLLYTAQAWGDAAEERPLRIVAVSTSACAVLSGDRVQPEKALLLGPVRVVPQEYPSITCRHVDIDPAAADPGQLARELLLEFRMPRPEAPVAYRGGRRWEQVYIPQRLEAAQGEPPVLRRRGVYLITGGTGGIGMVLARYLAENLQAKLVLTARSGLPPRAAWDALLEDRTGSDRIRRRIRQVRELEQLGSEVMVTAAEVSDEARMREVFDEVHRQFGAINGVIHAAGIAGAGLVQLKTADAAEAVLGPKVRGTRVLEKLLGEQQQPDFMVLCSSVNSLCGGVGAVDYCAANAFLDAFASAGGRGFPVVSINWDGWQEVGMAVETEIPADMQEARRRILRIAIRPAEGVEAFRRILAGGLEQIAVVTRDLSAVIAAFLPRGRTPAAARTPLSASGDQTTAPAIGNDSQQKVLEIWRQMLGIQTIGLDDNFFELGGHSLLATAVLSRLREIFRVSLPLRTIFEAPTVRQFAERIETLAWTASPQAPPVDASEREEIEI